MTGDDLRDLRTRLGFKQQHISTYLGVSTSAWQKWEAADGPLHGGAASTLLTLLAEAEARAGSTATAEAVVTARSPVEVVKALARLVS